MTQPPPAAPLPRFGDVVHVGHVELLTPRPDESLTFFTSVVGLHETGRSGPSVYLRAWGDYERHTLKLTAHSTSGLGHLGLRVRDEATLQRLVSHLEAHESYGTPPAPAAAGADKHRDEIGECRSSGSSGLDSGIAHTSRQRGERVEWPAL